jgi:hypothetical protein
LLKSFFAKQQVDIFMGVVFYQRLRHMVGDKFQSRADGAVNQLTHQPVGGRKNAGGIRFGEMERDSIIAHGAAFLLNDRLMQSSDYSKVCKKLGVKLCVLFKQKKRPFVACSAGLFSRRWLRKEWRFAKCATRRKIFMLWLSLLCFGTWLPSLELLGSSVN